MGRAVTRSAGLIGVFLGALAAIVVVRFVGGPQDVAIALALFVLGGYLGYAVESRGRGGRENEERD